MECKRQKWNYNILREFKLPTNKVETLKPYTFGKISETKLIQTKRPHKDNNLRIYIYNF